MVRMLGVLLLLLTFLGAAYFHMFAWRPQHPDRAWPWQATAAFGSVAVIGLGLLLHSWALVLLGAAIRVFTWLMRDRAALE